MRVNVRECVLLVLLCAVIAALLNENGRLQKRVAEHSQTVRTLQQQLERLTAALTTKGKAKPHGTQTPVQ
jgi:hypothetical protein